MEVLWLGHHLKELIYVVAIVLFELNSLIDVALVELQNLTDSSGECLAEVSLTFGNDSIQLLHYILSV